MARVKLFNRSEEERAVILQKWPEGQSTHEVNEALQTMLAIALARPRLFYPLGILEAAVIVLLACLIVWCLPY